MMISKTALGIAAASAGICFIGYCIYFDYKRHEDPLFKQKLRERRKKKKERGSKGGGAAAGGTQLPDPKDTEAMQKFFMQEIQLGEDLLGQGDIENGVEHLSNAVAVCGQPHQLLQVLQQTLPPNVFQLLIQSMPSAAMRISSSASLSSQDDDLE